MISISETAKTKLLGWMSEVPGSKVRLSMTPGCPAPTYNVTMDEFTWPNDVTVLVDEIPFVHAKNLSHLLENVTIDLVSEDDDYMFLVQTTQVSAC